MIMLLVIKKFRNIFEQFELPSSLDQNLMKKLNKVLNYKSNTQPRSY